MDIFDDATEAEERHRDLSINRVRSQKPLKFSGRCLSCNDSIDVGRFCPGGECKEQFELEQKLAYIKGFR